MFESALTISRAQHDGAAVKIFTDITGYVELYTRSGRHERDEKQKKLPLFRSALHQWKRYLEAALRARIDGELVSIPQRCAGVFAIAAQRIKADIELL